LPCKTNFAHFASKDWIRFSQIHLSSNFNIWKPCLWKKEKVSCTQTSPTKISRDNTWERNLPMTHNSSQLKPCHKQPTLNTWYPVMYFVYHCGLLLAETFIS
jgi:hypothetical protein